MEILGPVVILHSKVQGQKGKVVRYVVDSREARNEVESGAVRNVMNFRVAGHGVEAEWPNMGESWCRASVIMVGAQLGLTSL